MNLALMAGWRVWSCSFHKKTYWVWPQFNSRSKAFRLAFGDKLVNYAKSHYTRENGVLSGVTGNYGILRLLRPRFSLFLGFLLEIQQVYKDKRKPGCSFETFRNIRYGVCDTSFVLKFLLQRKIIFLQKSATGSWNETNFPSREQFISEDAWSCCQKDL